MVKQRRCYQERGQTILSKNSAPMFSRPCVTDAREKDSLCLGVSSAMRQPLQLKDKEVGKVPKLKGGPIETRRIRERERPPSALTPDPLRGRQVLASSGYF